MVDSFTYASYRIIVNRLTDGRTALRFADKPELHEGGYVILRHDVDFNPPAALDMAEIEADMGVHSTYFFLFSSPHYNLFDAEHGALLRQISNMGHEIGLHYDIPALCTLAPNDPSALLQHQVKVLAELAGAEVVSASMHNPSVEGDKLQIDLGKLINAYDSKYTRDIIYLSDSCGAWRNDAHRILTGDSIPDRLQFLVHPIFWSHQPRDRWQTLELLRQHEMKALDERIRALHLLWSNHMGVKEHDVRTGA